ncbi:MAG: pentapeptide repeat-containing protein [Chloroflexota bacterium]
MEINLVVLATVVATASLIILIAYFLRRYRYEKKRENEARRIYLDAQRRKNETRRIDVTSHFVRSRRFYEFVPLTRHSSEPQVDESPASVRALNSDFWHGLSTEMAGALITTIIFAGVVGSFEWRSERNSYRNQLINEVASGDNSSALRAVSLLRDEGWLTDGSLRGTNLFGADLRGANLHEADLTGADLRRATLDGADLQFANLTGVELEDASFVGANLRYATISGVNIGTNVRDASLVTAIGDIDSDCPLDALEGSNAVAQLDTLDQRFVAEIMRSGVACEVSNATFDALMNNPDENAIMIDAYGYAPRLDFSGANLAFTDMSNSDLSFSVFRNSIIAHTVFTGSNIYMADFTDATGVYEAALGDVNVTVEDQPQIDRDTMLPHGGLVREIDFARYTDPEHPDYLDVTVCRSLALRELDRRDVPADDCPPPSAILPYPRLNGNNAGE